MALNLREEFRLKKIGFQNVNPGRFLTFQWRLPGFAFIIYRIILAVYTLIWLGITADHGSVIKSDLAWGSFLTNWTYVLLTLYFTYNALVVIIVYSVNCRDNNNLFKRQTKTEHWMLFHEVSTTGYEDFPSSSPTSRFSLPWYYAIVWILFNAVSVAAVVVTLVFWIILVPSNTGLGQPDNDNIQLHLINSVLILIEHALTAIPVRLMHVLYPILYGIIYVLFSVFYWVEDHNHVMYDILNWSDPGPTIGYVLLIGFVIIPLIHIIMYGLYRFKIYIFQRTCE